VLWCRIVGANGIVVLYCRREWYCDSALSARMVLWYCGTVVLLFYPQQLSACSVGVNDESIEQE